MTLEGNATFQEVFSMVSLTDLIKLLPWCVSSAGPFCHVGEVLATAMQQGKNVQSTATAAELEGSLALDPSSSPAHPIGTPPLPGPPLPDIPFVGTPQVGHPFAEFLAISTEKKWDCSSSSSLDNHQNKRTGVDSQEVKVRSEHSSAQGDEDTSKLIPETGTSFEQWGQEPVSPPSSPTRATTDAKDGTAAGSSKSIRYQASSDSESPREDVDDSDMDTASCSETDEVPYKLPTRSTGSGYGLPVDWAKAVSGWKLNWKGSATVTRRCGDMTIRALEQRRMVLLQKTATPLRCKKWQSGLTNCSASLRLLAPKFTLEGQRPKPMVGWRLWYCCWNNTMPTNYQFYEKGATRAMVDPQGLHTSNAFWCCNESASVGLKSFWPWCFKLGDNMETIVTHLRGVHYWLAITCNICKAFASMSTQIVLQHSSGCKVKLHKKKFKTKEREKAS